MRYVLVLLIHSSFLFSLIAQPGETPQLFHFHVYYKGQNVLAAHKASFELLWRNKNAKSEWIKATVENDRFIAGPMLKKKSPVELKIYNRQGFDTMFITCYNSLLNIPFQSGVFTLDKSVGFLANMQTHNGISIINQNWNNYRSGNTAAIPILQKKRHYYFTKTSSFFDEEESDFTIAGYNKSEHLKESDDNEVIEYISPGMLYYAPRISSSVYTIGYVNTDNNEKEKYNQYFLESTNQCKSWQVKFPLGDSISGLVNIKNGQYIFSTYNNNQLLIFNLSGKTAGSNTIDEGICNYNENVFYKCNNTIKMQDRYNAETPDIMMNKGNTEHIYYTTFAQNANSLIKINDLPFHPSFLSASGDGGMTWKKILELNAGDTYAYLTMRNNKLVLVSYNYTLSSTDFGKTWIFYRNGTFSGGEWNFMWLDDNTLINVTNYYMDIITIL